MRVIIEAWREGRREPNQVLSHPIEGDHAVIAAAMRDYADQGFTHMTAHRLDMVCDFCSEPSIVARFEIEPGGIIGRVVTDDQDVTNIDRDGVWGACHTCLSIIKRQDWISLADHAAQKAQDMHPVPEWMQPIIRESIAGGPIACFRRGYHGQAPISVISDEDLLS